MRLVIGLGNIGQQYRYSRHNAGFLCLQEWARTHARSFRQDRLFSYARSKEACLIMPATLMNRSGLALTAALKRWDPEELLVIHDDIELPLGQLRLRQGGGDGGHNGVGSLLEVLPPESLKRLRIGIGRDSGDPRDYVLDEFTTPELDFLDPVLKQAVEFVDIFIFQGFNVVLNAYSLWKKSCSVTTARGNISPKEKTNE